MTDANVVLGYLPESLLGGAFKLDREGAKIAVQGIADKLGIGFSHDRYPIATSRRALGQHVVRIEIVVVAEATLGIVEIGRVETHAICSRPI